MTASRPRWSLSCSRDTARFPRGTTIAVSCSASPQPVDKTKQTHHSVHQQAAHAHDPGRRLADQNPYTTTQAAKAKKHGTRSVTRRSR